jgi:hypothetical protein
MERTRSVSRKDSIALAQALQRRAVTIDEPPRAVARLQRHRDPFTKHPGRIEQVILEPQPMVGELVGNQQLEGLRREEDVAARNLRTGVGLDSTVGVDDLVLDEVDGRLAAGPRQSQATLDLLDLAIDSRQCA